MANSVVYFGTSPKAGKGSWNRRSAATGFWSSNVDLDGVGQRFAMTTSSSTRVKPTAFRYLRMPVPLGVIRGTHRRACGIEPTATHLLARGEPQPARYQRCE